MINRVCLLITLSFPLYNLPDTVFLNSLVTLG